MIDVSPGSVRLYNHSAEIRLATPDGVSFIRLPKDQDVEVRLGDFISINNTVLGLCLPDDHTQAPPKPLIDPRNMRLYFADMAHEAVVRSGMLNPARRFQAIMSSDQVDRSNPAHPDSPLLPAQTPHALPDPPSHTASHTEIDAHPTMADHPPLGPEAFADHVYRVKSQEHDAGQRPVVALADAMVDDASPHLPSTDIESFESHCSQSPAMPSSMAPTEYGTKVVVNEGQNDDRSRDISAAEPADIPSDGAAHASADVETQEVHALKGPTAPCNDVSQGADHALNSLEPSHSGAIVELAKAPNQDNLPLTRSTDVLEPEDHFEIAPTASNISDRNFADDTGAPKAEGRDGTNDPTVQEIPDESQHRVPAIDIDEAARSSLASPHAKARKVTKVPHALSDDYQDAFALLDNYEQVEEDDEHTGETDLDELPAIEHDQPQRRKRKRVDSNSSIGSTIEVSPKKLHAGRKLKRPSTTRNGVVNPQVSEVPLNSIKPVKGSKRPSTAPSVVLASQISDDITSSRKLITASKGPSSSIKATKAGKIPSSSTRPAKASGTSSGSAVSAKLPTTTSQIINVFFADISSPIVEDIGKRRLIKLGIKEVFDVSESHVFCTKTGNQFTRTMRLLLAISLGKTVVADDWLLNAKETGVLRDPDEYPIENPSIVAEFDTTITEAASRYQGGCTPLQGKNMRLSTNLSRNLGLDKLKHLRKLLSSLGASSCSTGDFKRQPSPDTICIGTNDPKEISLAKKLGYRLYSKEVLTAVVLQGKLDPDNHTFLLATGEAEG